MRLTQYFESIYHKQKNKKGQFGRVLGCPYFTLGAEGALDEKILHEVQKVLSCYIQYFASAIGDAQTAGEIPKGDTQARARCVFSLYEGTMTRARIQNDVELLRDLPGYVLQLLGARATA